MISCVRGLVCVTQHGRCSRVQVARTHEREHRRGVVPRLLVERREIDGAPVEPRRRAGLEPAGGQRQLAQARAKRLCRRIARAPGFVVLQPDVDQAGQEGARRQHDGLGLEAQPDLRDHAGHPRSGPVAVDGEIVDRLLEQREVRLVLEAMADRRLVEHAVGLRARCAHRRTLAGVERPELDARLVGRERHRPAQRVDFPYQMTLADAADRRIAGHLPQRFDVVRQQQRSATHPRAGERRLGAGMAATDDDDVESLAEVHD